MPLALPGIGAAGIENDDPRRGVRLRHGIDDLVQRQRAMLGIIFGLDIRIDGKQIVDALDLHTVTGKEEQSHLMRFEQLAERLKVLIHFLRGAIQRDRDVETITLQLCPKVGRVIGRVFQFIAIGVIGIAYHKCSHRSLQAILPWGGIRQCRKRVPRMR
jgi:hypothetical protein